MSYTKDMFMVYSLLFIVELLLLANLSKFLTRRLSAFYYRIFNSQKVMIHALAIMYLPGTIIHELSHMFLAGLMLVHVGNIEVYPEVREDGVRLGSAEIGVTDPFRRMIIGVAPVLVGLLMITLGAYFLQSNWGNLAIWQIILAIYLFFEVGNTMFSSKKDMEGVVSFFSAILIVTIIVIAALYFSGIMANFDWLNSLNQGALLNIVMAVDLALLVPIGIDTLLLGVTYLLKR